MAGSQWVGVDHEDGNEIPEITVRSVDPPTIEDEKSQQHTSQLKQPLKLNASLIRLKILEALRNNDQEKLSQIFEEARQPLNAYDPQIANVLHLILHYAVQVGPLSMVQYIVSNNLVDDINAQDYEGSTPLHLATASSRYDIVNYLMNLPGINDCIVNNAGEQAIELTDDLGIIQLITDIRTKFVELNANDLRRAFESKNYDKLTELLSNQRVSELLDINGTDPITGDGVLHEFVKKDDVTMCKFILQHGGDPFKRNTLGKLPIDLAFSQAMKKLLKESSKEQSIVDPMGNGSSISDQPPTYKGFLKKWTNYAGGYKLRWFVLDEDGRLSYYKSPNDINKNCRGAISLANARLRMDSSEKSKFEIEIPNNPGNPIRWHLKSNHYIELNRWVWFLQNAIRYCKDVQRNDMLHQAAPSKAQKMNLRNIESFDSKGNNSTLNITRPIRPPQRAFSQGSLLSVTSSDNESADSEIVKTKSKVKKLKSKLTLGNSNNSNKRLLEEIGENNRLRINRLLAQSAASSIMSSSKANSIHSVSPSVRSSTVAAPSGGGGANGDQFYDESDPDDDDETQTVDQETGDIIEKKSGPHGSQIIVLQNNLKIEVGSLKEFMIHGPPTSAEDIKFICIHTLTQVENLLQELKLTINSRDEKILKKFNRQKEISTLWENSIKSLEFEMREKEQKIVALEDKQQHLKKILKHKFGSSGQLPTVNNNNNSNDPEDPLSNRSVTDSKDDELVKFLEEQNEDSDDEFFDAVGEDEEISTVPPTSSTNGSSFKASTPDLSLPPPPAFSPPPPPPPVFADQNQVSSQSSLTSSMKSAPSIPQLAPPIPHVPQQQVPPMSAAPPVPQLAQPMAAAPPVPQLAPPVPRAGPSAPSSTPSVHGAPSERTLAEPVSSNENVKEAVVDDNDPVVKSVLSKNFTNPLQKEKLIVIAKKEGSFKGYEDPVRTRLAMSEDDRPKISLWGILKSMVGKDMTKMTLPVSFNEPTSLLQRVAEDMEYTNLLDTAAQQSDSTLRMVYVAAFAASEYASTINRVAKPFNPLLGETYEYARPDRGFRFLVEQVSHHPPISAAMAESENWDYYGESFVKSKFYGRSFDIKPLGSWFLNLRPDSGSINHKNGANHKDELYTWKKVTSSVIGIIVGNPTVDNYGDMEILNHNTGDSIIFSFKARGWRESSAYEVKGTVLDNKKQPRWQVSGHWNSKIFAKKIGGGKKSKDDIFLVWEANARPKIPFNLTEFATSLNAPQKHLMPWLPRTDTRLRPDQRAMEDGRYNDAVTEKERVEEKQRAAKRLRDARMEKDPKAQPYKPFWFTKERHPVTGEEYWHYNGEYWKKRFHKDLQHVPDIF